ncbi:hypothetical protein HELRODRAFT_82276 [Helobdella robusta]|uniref:Innexin n=1 Tax=Helobdella robusta TaxID=6412 RepID=T1G4P9_HELRO|nr:hypothetical protein HELRODRAFT_82276 [Helobdella robusta]ESO01145.1 hypothetical protein HELRODRAFT_82276 [Helobdella robusta]
MFTAIGKVFKSSRNDDDLVDRMNHQYSVIFLFIFMVIISTSQYVGEPIHCWMPGHFTPNQGEYANRVCWISYTYSVPENTLVGQQDIVKKVISYYQWVPLVMLLQAFFFYLPCLLWRVFSERSGININNLVEAAETIQNALYPERRDKTIKYMIRHLDHYLDYQREYQGGCCGGLRRFMARKMFLICGNRQGNYLLTLYLISKVMYLANLVCQLFILNLFLGTNYHLYGVEVIRDIVLGKEVKPSVRFPLTTLCDFKIHVLGNTHNHTVQCVLPINFFNEKIYLFLWFWMVLVAAATIISLLRWIWLVGFRHSRIRYVRKHLKVMGKLNRDSDRDRKLSRKFAQMYLRQDGVFVLKLVAKNSTDLVVADIVSALWDNYKNKPMIGARNNDDQEVDDGGEIS